MPSRSPNRNPDLMMKKTLAIMAAAAALHAAHADLTVMTDSNGVVTSPANFAEANAPSWREALFPDARPITATNAFGILRPQFPDGVESIQLTNVTFYVSHGAKHFGVNMDEQVMYGPGFALWFAERYMTAGIGSPGVILGWTDTNLAVGMPLDFGGSTSHVATHTRTNLGIPWSGLTNTNAAGMWNALGSMPSGGAAVGAILRAVPGGGSAFVESKTIAHRLTNDSTKTGWTTNGINQSGNIGSSPFPAWTVEPGTYRITWSVWFASDSTNSGLVHGVVVATNFGLPQQNAGSGLGRDGNVAAVTSSTNSDQTIFAWPAAANGGSQSNRVLSGSMAFIATTNTTLVYSWCPQNNVTNVLALKAGSTISVEKISP